MEVAQGVGALRFFYTAPTSVVASELEALLRRSFPRMIGSLVLDANPTLRSLHHRYQGVIIMHSDPFEALVLTILSQNRTGEIVRKVCPTLEARCRGVTPRSLATLGADDLREVIRSAGPYAGGRLRGLVQQPRRVRRVVESVVRYLLRLTSRATPFGLFAGVAPLRIGSTASVRWGGRHHAAARPDAAWLAAVITHLEARPDVLSVCPSWRTTWASCGETGWWFRANSTPAFLPRSGPPDVSVRHTRAVQAVIQAAQSPITIVVVTVVLGRTATAITDPTLDAAGTGFDHGR